VNGFTIVNMRGFVDSHGHVVMGGLQVLSANLLAAPDGEVTDIASLQDTLRRTRTVKVGGISMWLWK
jgi:predicted amidohydrolase YtcJ